MNVRIAQFLIKVTVEASHDLLGLESLNRQIDLLKCLLDIEKVHILILFLRWLE